MTYIARSQIVRPTGFLIVAPLFNYAATQRDPGDPVDRPRKAEYAYLYGRSRDPRGCPSLFQIWNLLAWDDGTDGSYDVALRLVKSANKQNQVVAIVRKMLCGRGQ